MKGRVGNVYQEGSKANNVRRRRVQSVDASCANVNKANLVENTLQEIRGRPLSSRESLSSHEIDDLLGNIRRSRSLSQDSRERPRPPAYAPPPLPADFCLPFGATAKTVDTTCNQEPLPCSIPPIIQS